MLRVLPAVLLFVTAATGPSEASPEASGLDWIFDSSRIRTYAVTLPPDDWQWLQDNASEEQYVAANLRISGAEYGPIGIRFKGGAGTLRRCFDGEGHLICPKLSIKLRFDEYDPDGRFHGVTRLNFHSMVRDSSKMREVISYGLFRKAGVFAPRAHYARLSINGAEQGLFALVEQVDGQFVQSRFPDGGAGNLYKEIWPTELTPEPYLASLRAWREEPPNAERMVRFARALQAADDSSFESVLSSWTDIDALMRHLAVDRLLDHRDGMTSWFCSADGCRNHNYYWYQESARDRLWLIPWDLDRTFSPNPRGRPDWSREPRDCRPVRISPTHRALHPGCDPFIRKLATVTWDQYAAATRSILETVFQPDLIHAQIESLRELILDDMLSDPNGPPAEEWHRSVDELKRLVTERYVAITARIDH